MELAQFKEHSNLQTETGIFKVEITECMRTKTSKKKLSALLLNLRTMQGYEIEHMLLLEGKGTYYSRRLLEAVDLSESLDDLRPENLIGRELLISVRRQYSEENSLNSWLQVTDTYPCDNKYEIRPIIAKTVAKK